MGQRQPSQQVTQPSEELDVEAGVSPHGSLQDAGIGSQKAMAPSAPPPQPQPPGTKTTNQQSMAPCVPARQPPPPGTEAMAGGALVQFLLVVTLWLPPFLCLCVIYFAWLIVHQLVVLPFRITPACSGAALKFLGPVIGGPTALFIQVVMGEPCFGCELHDVDVFDTWLQRFSASRRKNIKRNVKNARKELAQKGIVSSYFSAGEWRFSAEHRHVIWEGCRRHKAQVYGLTNKLFCGFGVPTIFSYMFEVIFILAFPCDIQLFRTDRGELISLNTRAHVGNVYFQPNYACMEEFSRCGIYALSARHQMEMAIALKAKNLNAMPSMREAKAAIGLHSMQSRSLAASCHWCSAVKQVPEMLTGANQLSFVSSQPMSGQSRHRPKKAEAVDQQAKAAKAPCISASSA